MIKQKYALPSDGAEKVLEAVTRKFAGHRANASDGLRVDLPQGWVHVRASNTEPILRVIAEARTEAEAAELVAQVRAAGRL
jgi:phosphomannomutase